MLENNQYPSPACWSGVPLCGYQSVSQDFVADTVDLGPTVKKTKMKPKKKKTGDVETSVTGNLCDFFRFRSWRFASNFTFPNKNMDIHHP